MKAWLKTGLYALAGAVIVASLTAAVTVRVLNRQRGDSVTLSIEEYARLQDLQVLDEIMRTAESDALEAPPARAQMIERAANGVVDSLNDPYAAYYTPEEYEAYLSNVNGAYTGIGLLISQPDATGAAVLDVYEGYSAALAGIQVGDVILTVNGNPTPSMTLEEISTQINGEAGERSTLEVLRGSETLTFAVESGQVNIARVESALFNERTAYIRIDMFTGNCVSEFEAAIKDKTERGMRSLVIDLRNNPGGSLEDVIDIADTLLGDCTIVSVRDKNGTEHVYKGKGKGVGVPLAVLVNENSASASEILAAAVQDNEKGAIVGMTTFGKGIVQTTRPLSGSNGWLKLTTDAYYTPSGKSIHGSGVTPDVEVDLPDDMKGMAVDQIDQADDAQLWAALDYVRDLANAA